MAALRIGIVGVGRHGSRYAKHAAEDVAGLELVAICRRDRVAGGELAARYGCEYVADAVELVTRPDLDAVVLVTVPSLLESLIPAAVETGKRLLVEKPCAASLAAGLRIRSRIEKSDAYCMVGQTLRFNSVCRRIKELVPGLGRIDSLVFSQRFPPQLQLDWLDDPDRSGGGNILHTGVHCFDLIRFLTGLGPTTAACMTRSICTSRTEDSFVAQLGFGDSDALALVTCSRTTECRNGLIEITGEHGQLVGDHVLNTLLRLGPDGKEEIDVPAPTYTVLETLRRFARDANEGSAPAISYDDGLAAVAIADACYRAAASGSTKAIVLPDAGS